MNIGRREFVRLVSAMTVSLPHVSRAQPNPKVARLGYIGTTRDIPLGRAIYDAFLDEMRTLGFGQGQNFIVEFRPIEQDLQGLASAASELVSLNVDVILTDGTESALRAAVGASSKLPIVMIATNFNPIEHGYVKGLPRPGGNVTGLFLRQTELAEKQTELLWQAVPDKQRLAIIWDTVSTDQFEAAERRAKALGLIVQSLRLANPPYDFEDAFRGVARDLPHMLLVLSSPHFTSARVQIAQLAIEYHLPSMFIFKTYAQAGGLLSYGADYVAMHRQAANYVAKILQGANPADLPVEQPNKYELVVNLKTAKALGMTIPPTLLARADELIE